MTKHGIDQRKLTLYVGLAHYRDHALKAMREKPDMSYFWKDVLAKIDDAEDLLASSDLTPRSDAWKVD